MKRPDKKTLTKSEFSQVYPEKYLDIVSRDLVEDPKGSYNKKTGQKMLGYIYSCDYCGESIWVNRSNIFQDTARDGLIRCHHCGIKKAMKTMGPEKLSERASKGLSTCNEKRVGWRSIEARQKSVDTCRENKSGVFDPDVRRRACESYNKYCAENPDKVCCGALEPLLWKLGSRKIRFVDSYGDIQEIDALFEVNGKFYAVEEDDPSHQEGRKKFIGYHKRKDEEIMKKFNAPCLHIITSRCYDKNGPQSGFNSYIDLIEAFITETLPEGFPLIDLSNKSVYGDIEY